MAHETGHQWWGSLICNANDRNYWFVESLAELSSALYVERVYGKKKYLETRSREQQQDRKFATQDGHAEAAMLEKAAPLAGDGLSFALCDIARFEDQEGTGFDLVLSNAALHWIPDHPALLAHLVRLLAPGGQLAVQVPANQTHASHRLANELAREEPFATALKGYVRHRSVLTPVEYALQLKRLGLVEEESRLQVYVHELSEPADIVEWCRGTLLTDYEKRLPADLWHLYLETYRRRIVAAIPDERPYLYTYQRILFSGRRPG